MLGRISRWGSPGLSGTIYRQLREDGLLVAGHVVDLRENSASGTIREVAESWNASMLVIGSHGRSGVKRLVLGSTADALTRG